MRMFVQETRGDCMKCKECKAKMYDYAREKTRVSVCFKCGLFRASCFDESLALKVKADPSYILYLIESKYLEPTKAEASVECPGCGSTDTTEVER